MRWAWTQAKLHSRIYGHMPHPEGVAYTYIPYAMKWSRENYSVDFKAEARLAEANLANLANSRDQLLGFLHEGTFKNLNLGTALLYNEPLPSALRLATKQKSSLDLAKK